MILDQIESMGLQVALKDDGDNLFITPQNRITPHIRKFIRDKKAAIIHEMLMLGVGEHPGRVMVKPFEPTPVEPKYGRAIVTFVIGEAMERLARYTLPRLEQYAWLCAADLIVVRDNQLPQWPIGNKLRFGEIAGHYEQALLIDIDVWINRDVPDIFDEHPAGCWMHPDVDSVNENGFNFLTNELRVIAKQQNREILFREGWKRPGPQPPLFNTGVLLIDYEHAIQWAMPPDPITTSHTAEQAWIDLMLTNIGFVRRLDATWNWCAFQQTFKHRVHTVNFVHLANLSHADRLRWLRRKLS